MVGRLLTQQCEIEEGESDDEKGNHVIFHLTNTFFSFHSRSLSHARGFLSTGPSPRYAFFNFFLPNVATLWMGSRYRHPSGWTLLLSEQMFCVPASTPNIMIAFPQRFWNPKVNEWSPSLPFLAESAHLLKLYSPSELC